MGYPYCTIVHASRSGQASARGGFPIIRYAAGGWNCHNFSPRARSSSKTNHICSYIMYACQIFFRSTISGKLLEGNHPCTILCEQEFLPEYLK